MQPQSDRSCRALFKTNDAAVVNFDPSDRQEMICWTSLKNIAACKVGQPICGTPRRWTILFSAICNDGASDQYLESIPSPANQKPRYSPSVNLGAAR